jgi:hypothetical protein
MLINLSLAMIFNIRQLTDILHQYNKVYFIFISKRELRSYIHIYTNFQYIAKKFYPKSFQ